MNAISWPTVVLLLGVLACLGLLTYFDRSQAGVAVGAVGTLVAALLPALIRRKDEAQK